MSLFLGLRQDSHGSLGECSDPIHWTPSLVDGFIFADGEPDVWGAFACVFWDEEPDGSGGADARSDPAWEAEATPQFNREIQRRRGPWGLL